MTATGIFSAFNGNRFRRKSRQEITPSSPRENNRIRNGKDRNQTRDLKWKRKRDVQIGG